LLLAGDVEHEAEATIARTVGANARADVLKVPHHGSRTSSTPPFLAAVGPRLGVISAGLHNRFGHPHPEVVEALDARGVKTVRIDRTGGVTLVTDGRTWTARDRFGSVFWRLEP
jgi:competence protein ComEC